VFAEEHHASTYEACFLLLFVVRSDSAPERFLLEGCWEIRTLLEYV